MFTVHHTLKSYQEVLGLLGIIAPSLDQTSLSRLRFTMDHSKMNHGNMDHGKIGHGDMDMGACSMNASSFIASLALTRADVSQC
jgi:hypothetical protein